MPQRNKWSELMAAMPAERRARINARAQAELKQLRLNELRQARRLTQQQLAQTLGMSQAAVSQLEKRTDMYFSTLQNFVEAMGGQLELYAVFPDGKVELRLTEQES